jgi:hypothetical protein
MDAGIDTFDELKTVGSREAGSGLPRAILPPVIMRLARWRVRLSRRALAFAGRPRRKKN